MEVLPHFQNEHLHTEGLHVSLKRRQEVCREETHYRDDVFYLQHTSNVFFFPLEIEAPPTASVPLLGCNRVCMILRIRDMTRQLCDYEKLQVELMCFRLGSNGVYKN